MCLTLILMFLLSFLRTGIHDLMIFTKNDIEVHLDFITQRILRGIDFQQHEETQESSHHVYLFRKMYAGDPDNGIFAAIPSIHYNRLLPLKDRRRKNSSMLSALLPTQVEEVPPSERRDSMDLEDLDDGDSDVDITSAVNATNVLTEFDVNDNDDNVIADDDTQSRIASVWQRPVQPTWQQFILQKSFPTFTRDLNQEFLRNQNKLKLLLQIASISEFGVGLHPIVTPIRRPLLDNPG